MERTTTGGTRTTDAPPLKEDIIWTSMLQSHQTSMPPLAEDNSTLKPRKQNLCETTCASTAKSKGTEPRIVARNKLTVKASMGLDSTTCTKR